MRDVIYERPLTTFRNNYFHLYKRISYSYQSFIRHNKKNISRRSHSICISYVIKAIPSVLIRLILIIVVISLQIQVTSTFPFSILKAYYLIIIIFFFFFIHLLTITISDLILLAYYSFSLAIIYNS